MQKLISAFLLLVVISVLHTTAFAAPLKCNFKNADSRVEGIKSLYIADDTLLVNEQVVISLQHTRIKCGQFGKQHRFDGLGKGLQVILKSCTDQATLEGHIIDSLNSKAVEVVCNEVAQ